MTQIVRKKYSRRKHLTTLLNLNYLTNSWVAFYLSQRNYTRFYQGLNILNTQYISPSSDIVIKQANSNSGSTNIAILTLGTSTSYLNHLNKVQLNKTYLKDLIHPSPSTSSNKLLVSRDKSDLNFKSSGLLFDNIVDNVDSRFGLKSNLEGYTRFKFYSTSNLFSLTISCRRIITILTLLNIKR